ncbi:pentatricopeptide repeat-containing protein At1g62930, chloroplastic-like [Papaver somniferum]|uniref:pentatricopeptide repeat-containing protein At1g62930, chloroplastic-like n=1 Tax=Papaver somniferum TaxID=3469 RepID=UPI000E6F522D|nr:pentatricopeptide repeat-containing protein At1g62930, chloroplastic-like [Papaver somniferum]
MTQTGIQPDVVTCNTLIDGLCRTGEVGSALKLKNMMGKWNCRPNVVLYCAIINALCKGGRFNEAKRLLEEMVSRGISANLTTYNSMIHGHCLHGQREEARKYFDEMMYRRISPDTVTFSILIDSSCKDGMTEDAWGLFELKEKINIKPNRVTCNSMIGGLCLTGRLEEAIKLFDSMVERSLDPDDYSYSMLMDEYCRTRYVTCSTVLDGYWKNGKMEEAIELFNGLLRAGKMLSEAEKLVIEMEEKGCLPNARTCNTIVRAFLIAKVTGKALHFLRKMREKGICTNLRQRAEASSTTEVAELLLDTFHVISKVVYLRVAEFERDFLGHVFQHLVACKNHILQGVKVMNDAVSQIMGTVTRILVLKSMEDFCRQLRRVTATYKRTNTPVPVRHTTCVYELLRPLKVLHHCQVFLEGKRAKTSLRSEAMKDLLYRTTGDITPHYYEHVSDVDNETKKGESRLLKFRLDARSVTDKISFQLFLDIQEYGRGLEDLGINAAEINLYRSMLIGFAPDMHSPIFSSKLLPT